MNITSYKNQSGAVLMFSLVILLLITLAGVNMIQQNRIQFMMAANAQDQTTTFASAQNILEMSEAYVGQQRYKTWPLPDPIPTPVGTAYACNQTASLYNQLRPGEITGSLGLSQAVIDSGSTVAIIGTACLSVTDGESDCTPDAANPLIWSAGETHCNQSFQSKCPTEIYTIRATAINPTTSSKRIVEEKYAVRCDS